MSEWDKLSQWEKANITKYILYGKAGDGLGGGPGGGLRGPRGPRSEKTKEKIREGKKKNWANLPPEIREKRLEQLASASREYWANPSPKKREEKIETGGRWENQSPEKREEKIETQRRVISESWANLPPEEKEARGRAISEGQKKSGAHKKMWATRRMRYPPTGTRPK